MSPNDRAFWLAVAPAAGGLAALVRQALAARESSVLIAAHPSSPAWPVFAKRSGSTERGLVVMTGVPARDAARIVGCLPPTAARVSLTAKLGELADRHHAVLLVLHGEHASAVPATLGLAATCDELVARAGAAAASP